MTVTVGGTGGTDVTVDTDTVMTGDQDALTFTATDWSMAQTVTVAADQDDDPTHDSATLTHTVASTDTGYSGLAAPTLAVTVTDDEAPTGPAITVFGFGSESTPDTGDTFGAGETIEVIVQYEPRVTVTGTPRIALDIGGATRYAAFSPGDSHLSGFGERSLLSFRYTVRAGDEDGNGISVAANSLELNRGTIVARSGGAAANLAHAAIAADATRKVDGGPAGPAITVFGFGSESTPDTGDTFGAGETIEVIVQYEPRVTVTGTPRIALDIGGATRYAAFSSGDSHLSGFGERSLLSFRYTVRAGDEDGNGISVAANSLELNGGTIVARSGGVGAGLAHAAIAADSSRKVDGGTLAAPLAPTGLSATASGWSAIDLSWTAPAADATTRAAVTGYRVEVSNGRLDRLGRGGHDGRLDDRVPAHGIERRRHPALPGDRDQQRRRRRGLGGRLGDDRDAGRAARPGPERR